MWAALIEEYCPPHISLAFYVVPVDVMVARGWILSQVQIKASLLNFQNEDFHVSAEKRQP